MNPLYRLLQLIYDATIRPYLPRKLGLYNNVVVKDPKLFDTTDYRPGFKGPTVEVVHEFIREGDLVVCVGGGYGVMAVHVARSVGENGEVIVYEVAEERLGLLRETFEMNDVDDRIDLRHAAVGPVFDSWGTSNHSDTIHPENIPDCDVLELDCEGAEEAILSNLHHKPRIVIAEVHPGHGVDPDEVGKQLNQDGYEIVKRTELAEGDPPAVLLVGEKL